MIPAQTQRVLAFLLEASSYPHHPPTVTLVQTHASWVFLVPPLVYKMKKPVNFGFLDFSTLELRRADCEREVALNRRLAEGVYLGVEALHEHQGRLQWGGDGAVVEWLVKMRELDPRGFLNHLVKENAVGLPEMDRILERLRGFYAAQPPLPPSEVESATERLRQGVMDNFEAAQQFVGQSLSRPVLGALHRYAGDFAARQQALFASRRRGGWIRDCHGDLHLEHIHLTSEAVCIYDCIEFNTDFRHIDVACDIAFLAMDLDFNSRPDLATYLVDRFAVLLGDDGMKQLMDYYKCYRACVRGKVESLHSRAETIGVEEKAASLGLAQRYFRLALQYALAGSRPQLFVFMGKVACGKSALAEALGRETGWPVLSSDCLRKTLAGVPQHQRGSENERAALYGTEMTRKVYATLLDQAVESLRRGRNIILDATFSRQSHRDILRQRLELEGFSAIWIEARASEAVAQERLKRRDESSDVVSDARLEDYVMLSSAYQSPTELPDTDRLTISTDAEKTVTLEVLLSELAGRRAGSPAG